jgi:ABC-type Fe3+-hydroxamate transport system substrate-binding protein
VHCDQLGTPIHLNSLPTRIISLVPSQTELLFDLGLDEQIVGITKFCIHPAKAFKEKTIIGGTKKFDFDVIDRLTPDLIIGNKEENYKEGIGLLKEKYPVWMSDIVTLEDAFVMINGVGEICGKGNEASAITSNIEYAFGLLKKKPAKRVLYLIWRKPWMAAGAGTFIHSMIRTIGWKNAIEKKSRYPELSSEEIQSISPELILLSSEPYPFSEKHIDEIQQLVPAAKIMLLDGEMFSWYGSRLAKAPEYINSLAG